MAQQKYVPLYEQYGVSLEISGHDHDYERGHVGRLNYLVSGGGGAELRVAKCGVPDKPRCGERTAAFFNEHHYVSIEVQQDHLQLCPRRPDGTSLEACTRLPLRAAAPPPTDGGTLTDDLQRLRALAGTFTVSTRSEKTEFTEAGVATGMETIRLGDGDRSLIIDLQGPGGFTLHSTLTHQSDPSELQLSTVDSAHDGPLVSKGSFENGELVLAYRQHESDRSVQFRERWRGVGPNTSEVTIVVEYTLDGEECTLAATQHLRRSDVATPKSK